jgi:prepilin-type N-terminal cleavage/methylation domain-containing protein
MPTDEVSPLAVGSLRGKRDAALQRSAARRRRSPLAFSSAWRGGDSVRRAGFTLLEVLAAVAILGIAYISLGSSGIQGLQHEGEARRRFQASLLADKVLSEIESAVEAGGAPELGTDESEEDGFTVETEVAAFSLAIPDEAGEGGKRLGNARSRLGGSGAQAPQAAIPGPSLLGGERGAASPLRKIDVRVIWSEGFAERTVSRTTFALDREAAGVTLDAIAQSQAARGPQQRQPAAPNTLGGGNPGSIGTPQ